MKNNMKKWDIISRLLKDHFKREKQLEKILEAVKVAPQVKK